MDSLAEDVSDLDKLGGLILVIAELDQAAEELRTTAAWILGKACQNNLVVQKQVNLCALGLRILWLRLKKIIGSRDARQS